MSLTKAKELAVLSALSAHDMHGYAIATELGGTFGRLLGLKRPAIYAMLERFKKNAWIEGRLETGTAYPDREVFTLTAKGQKAMREMNADLARQANLPISPLLALLVAHEVSGKPLDAAKMIAERKSALAALDALGAEGHGQSPTLALGKALIAAELRVLKDAD